MPSGSVAAYQAALETTNTQMSYAMESTWATLPATTFQACRILSETLAHKKTRTRPPEVRGDRQAAPALTTQEDASGDIVFPAFYAESGRASQFDDFLSAVVGGDWQPPTVIAGVGGDIALSSGGVLTSTTSGKFTGILVSQHLKLSGFTNAINNGIYRVVTVTSGTSLTLAPLGFTPITETPAGTAAKIIFSNLRNGPFFKSIYLQKRLDPAPGTKFFQYPGAYPTKGTVSLSLGQFMQATFSFSVQQEKKALSDASTGGIVPAPNTRDLDPVAGFRGVFFNDAPLATGINSISFDLTNDGAAGEFFIGSALAQGMLGGTFMAGATCDLAFKDFTMYDAFRSETQCVFSAHYGDQAGNRYIFTLTNALPIFASGVPNSGANKMLMASVTFEGSPDTLSGCTLSIDRIPADGNVIVVPANTRARFAQSTATAGTSGTAAALFASMTQVAGASSDRNGTMTTTADGTAFTWIAVLSSAAGAGMHFFDGTGYGGFNGAASSGIYSGADADPTTISQTYTDGSGNVWKLYRSSGHSVALTFTLS